LAPLCPSSPLSPLAPFGARTTRSGSVPTEADDEGAGVVTDADAAGVSAGAGAVPAFGACEHAMQPIKTATSATRIRTPKLPGTIPEMIEHHIVRTNGIHLHVAEAGEGDPVILCHGFPESWYSWRHQLQPLADAGYRAIAPDQRGYGDSDRPKKVTDYDIVHLTDDLLGLLDEIGREKAVFVGHDWGALIVWEMARMHPDRTKAVVGVSVPYTPWPMPPTELFEAASGGNFFYILYFQEVGPAERELEADPRTTMAKTLYWASGDGMAGIEPTLASPLPREGTGFLTAMADVPDPLPDWLTNEDIDVYADQFKKSGFFGPVSYYRNFDRNYELNKELGPERISMPTFFIAGDRDPVPHDDGTMKALLPDFRGSVIIPGVGHWTQQEEPQAFNDALLGFLKEV
jgi:pimeloyl-ACP methyl ester carboxylesterase